MSLSGYLNGRGEHSTGSQPIVSQTTTTVALLNERHRLTFAAEVEADIKQLYSLETNGARFPGLRYKRGGTRRDDARSAGYVPAGVVALFCEGTPSSDRTVVIDLEGMPVPPPGFEHAYSYAGVTLDGRSVDAGLTMNSSLGMHQSLAIGSQLVQIVNRSDEPWPVGAELEWSLPEADDNGYVNLDRMYQNGFPGIYVVVKPVLSPWAARRKAASAQSKTLRVASNYDGADEEDESEALLCADRIIGTVEGTRTVRRGQPAIVLLS